MKVGLHATLRPAVGSESVELSLPEGATVGDLVDQLVARWPALREILLDEGGQLSRRVHVFVGGRSARYLDGARTRLGPDAEVDIVPAVAGG